MDREYPIAQAKDQLTQLVRLAEQGTAVRLTRRGRPVARIVSEHDFQMLKERGSAGLWATIERFRAHANFDGDDLEDRMISSWRDRSPDRPITLPK